MGMCMHAMSTCGGWRPSPQSRFSTPLLHGSGKYTHVRFAQQGLSPAEPLAGPTTD